MSKMPTNKIAVTGSIGSGKSTVTKLLSKRYPTISSDDIVHELYRTAEYASIINKKLFNIVSDQVDLNYIKERLFNDKDFKDELENVIHPLVIERIERFFSENASIVVVEVPLLFEAKMEHMFDTILLVSTEESILKQRLIEHRGFSEVDVEKRLSHQMSVSDKIKKSDYVITNNGTIEQLEEKVNDFVNVIERVI